MESVALVHGFRQSPDQNAVPQQNKCDFVGKVVSEKARNQGHHGLHPPKK